VCVAVPGRVVDVYSERGMAMAGVDFGGQRREVCLEFCPEARSGDWVLVHLGTALTCMDEQTATETLALLAEAGLMDVDGAAAPAGS
jgi:hydrogenase expression/formation protein HypC